MASPAQHAQQLLDYAKRLEEWASPEVTERAMTAVGQQARLIIYKRTVEDGLDRDGNPFPAYSTRRTSIMPSSPYFGMLSGAGRTYRARKGDENQRAAASTFGAGRVKRKGRRRDKLKGVVFDYGWAQIKDSLGAAKRNMMMKGDMMGQAVNPGFVITAKSGESVTLDFLNALDRLKAAGQHLMFNWWGVGRIQSEREALAAAFMEAWKRDFPRPGGAAR